ncbi:MAG TPA: hypothetical protein VG712_01515, partial [Gemmatimonadales bacterium]|nr:hypothetical protein [Gemmatimonadales bacterium]
PLQAQSAEYTPHGFLSTRYDSHTSSNMYFGYTTGPVTPMIALVSNPRTDYREHLVGVVRSDQLTPRFGVTYALAAAKAIDSWYGQLYILPAVSFGRLQYDATFELYVPLEEPGVHQFGMNPGNLMYDLTPTIAVGAVGVWASQSNAPHSFGAGPSLKVRVPKGSITVDGVMGVTRWESEWRVSFFTRY